MTKPKKQPNENLEKLIRVPCDNCDGQGWYYLAWKHPNGEQATAGCEQCFGSREQWESRVEKVVQFVRLRSLLHSTNNFLRG